MVSRRGYQHPAEARQHWGSQVEFILACLGFAVGLGNVWRFPYLCGRSGGAAFLVPYLIMMVVAGLPAFYMELAIGQYAQLTPAMVYNKMAPLFAGIGGCMMLAATYTALTYNVIIAWSLHYLGNSFQNPLPWSHCTSEFNTLHCFDDVLYAKCIDGNLTYYKGECVDAAGLDMEQWNIDRNWRKAVIDKFRNRGMEYELESNLTDDSNITSAYDLLRLKVSQIYAFSRRVSPTEEYLYRRMLNLAKSVEPEDYGNPNWEIAVCLFASWFLVFLCIMGGTKTEGKVVYFTATFPYVILVILLCRGVTLGEGVVDGLKFFLVPKMEELTQARVWGDAATQIFFSLGLGTGGLVTIASYNHFHNNIFRDTLIVVLGNCGTSIFAGLVIFPVVGYIAHKLNVEVSDIAQGGIGLAFQIYPHAINRMAIPQLWAFLFFFMLVLLGIGSQLVIVDALVTVIVDEFPQFRGYPRKAFVVAGVCFAGFLVGIVFTTPGGPFMLTIITDYGSGWPAIIACILELILVMYVYGYRRFICDVSMMLGEPKTKLQLILGYPVNIYWIANWTFFCPALLIAVLVFSFTQYSRTTHDSSYTFPMWADGLGICVTLSCVLIVPIFAVVNVIKFWVNGKDLMELLRPTQDWGPGEDQPDAP